MGVVAAAVTLFIAQVATRVAVFFEYKTNVAVKVKYVKEIDFPSVTICNQNNFRFVNLLFLPRTGGVERGSYK